MIYLIAKTIRKLLGKESERRLAYKLRKRLSVCCGHPLAGERGNKNANVLATG